MGNDLVNPEDLAMLVRVVDAGGVTRAAEVLYVSQPAVTRRLRRLERALGARLVERSGRGLALTDAGRAILPLARQALHLLDQLPGAIAEVQGLLRGEIILGASTTVGEFVLPKRLAAFAQAYPHLIVRLHIANTHGIVERVLDHSLHAGFVGLRPEHSALLTSPFLSDQILLVAVASHPLAGRRVSPADVGQTRLLLREEGSATRTMALRALTRCGVQTESAVGFGSNAAVRTAVLAGYGIAALSHEVVADDLAQGRLKPVRLEGWRCHRRFYIIRRRDRRLSKGEELLLEFVRREGGA
jgi:DNA-binding transcriptional LysR family regulator